VCKRARARAYAYICACIINRFINEHPVSGQWKIAYISSIYTDPNSYQRISVISTMNRLYDKVLNSLIENVFSNFEEKEQNGFRAGRSCTDNIFCLKQVIKKIQVYIIFVDLKKAWRAIEK